MMNFIFEQHLLLLLKFYNDYGAINLREFKYMKENLTFKFNDNANEPKEIIKCQLMRKPHKQLIDNPPQYFDSALILFINYLFSMH